MQVKAHQVFGMHGPQPYALAVLGAFTGTLASPGNPAVAAGASAGTAGAACPIVVTTITEGPSGLTNKTCACTPHAVNFQMHDLHLPGYASSVSKQQFRTFKSSSQAFSRCLGACH